MKKETFLFYADWLNVIRDLPSEVQLEVYQAIAEYAIYDNLIELKPLAKVAFGFIKQTIDRDTQKYISISEKRSEAGKRGGRPLKNNELKESNEKQKKQLLSEKSKKSNCPLNDNDNDISFLKKETKSDFSSFESLENENSESPIETLQTPKEQSGGGRKKFTIPTPEEVQAYCDERKNGILGQQFCDFYSSKGWKIGKEPMKDWKAAVRTWEMRRKDSTPSVAQPQSQNSPPKRIRFDEYGNEVVY